MIKRKTGWPEILAAEIEAASHKPFKYGSHDCCMFAAHIVKAMTGTDFARGLRGYRSAASAQRMLNNKGYKTLPVALYRLMRKQGCKQIPPAMARRGDVVLGTDENDAPAVGICVGGQAVFASDGIALLPMTEIKKAYRCG